MTWDCLAAPARGIARRRWAELACQPVVNPVASGGARLRLRSDLRWLGGLVAAAVLIPLLAPLSGLSGGAMADPRRWMRFFRLPATLAISPHWKN